MERLKQMSTLPTQLVDPLDARWRTFLSDTSLVADPEAEVQGDWLGKNWSQEEKRVFMEKFLQYPKVGARAGGPGARGGGGRRQAAGRLAARPLGARRAAAAAWCWAAGLPGGLVLGLPVAAGGCWRLRGRGLPRALRPRPSAPHPLQDFASIAQHLPGRTVAECVVFFYKHQKLEEFSAVRWAACWPGGGGMGWAAPPSPPSPPSPAAGHPHVAGLPGCQAARPTCHRGCARPAPSAGASSS
jgi:hypothetical protein